MSTEAVITKRKRGDTYDLLATIKLNGAVFDLTGSTNHQLLVDESREVASGGTAARTLSGTISGDATLGVLAFDMTATGNPADLDKGEYHAEITFLNAAGRRMTTETFEYHQLGSLRG